MIFTIILARLLTPEDFGLVGMSMILLGFANLITEFGMSAAVVQTSEDVNKAAHYAFVINMAASVLINILVVIFALPFAHVFGGGEELAQVIRYRSIYITISGLSVVPGALLQRELRFKQLGLSQIPAELTSTGGAIILALMGFGVWSLVIGGILGEIIRAVLLWSYERPWIWLRPQKWDWQVAGSILKFGIPTFASSGTRYFQDQVDTWFVGRRLGATAVGLYGKAFSLTTTIVSLLTGSLFVSVLFPSYAKIKEDKPRLTRAYLKSTTMVFLIVVPISIGLAITAPLLVPVLLGKQWLAMIPAWQMFSLFGLTRPISVNSSPVFLAVGQPQRNLSASAVLLVVLLPLLFIFVDRYDIVGAAAAVSISHLVAMLFNVFQVNQILPGTARRTLLQSIPFLVSGGLMALGVLLLQDPILALAGGPNVWALIMVIAAGAIIYIAITLLLQWKLVIEIYELIIVSLRLDERWPRLLPPRLRVTK
ncbi:MAG: lipopolysaccharide biosynthesis protein [Candidatus Promineofilum sp.]|nr:lipopolysaccharide biosynthesis protein [Promineifilum sp.]